MGGNDCVEAYKQDTLLKPLLHFTLAKTYVRATPIKFLRKHYFDETKVQ